MFQSVRMRRFSAPIVLLAVAAVVIASPLFAAELTGLERRVRHELVMLPYYGVFDNLEFRVEGSKVTLMGQVHRPSLKKSAERVVKRLESVEQVVNRVAILPTSSQDDRIRQAV